MTNKTQPKKPASNPSGKASRPGKLRGSYSIILHTRQAQRLFLGRRKTDDKPAIIGLTAFSSMISKIWEAAAQDDPYADWFLLKAEQAIEEAQAQIKARQHEVDVRLKSRERVHIEVAASLEPVEMPLGFPTPFGYMGAYLIEDYDQLVLSLLTAVHVALMPRDAAMAALSHTGRIIRRTFLTPTQYKHLAITRKDLEMMTQRGAEAVKAMGELSKEVLEGTLRSRYAPAIQAPGSKAKVDLLDDEEEDDSSDAGEPSRVVQLQKSEGAV
jgi:integrating conjugative element protein (TIGR03761 family)